MGVTVGRLNLKDTITELQDRYVERTTTKVVHGNLFVGTALFEPVRQRCSRRLVYDALYFQAGNLTGVFGRVALRVVEVGRHGNDRFGYFVAQKRFGVSLQLAENHGADFFRAVLFVAHLYLYTVAALHDFVTHQLQVALDFFVVKVAADEPFYFINSVFAVGNLLAARYLPDQAFTVLIHSYDRWRRARTFTVSDNFRLTRLHNSHRRVRST